MKIQFDNQQEESALIDSLLNTNTCPEELLIEHDGAYCNEKPDCKQCWKEAIKKITGGEI